MVVINSLYKILEETGQHPGGHLRLPAGCWMLALNAYQSIPKWNHWNNELILNKFLLTKEKAFRYSIQIYTPAVYLALSPKQSHSIGQSHGHGSLFVHVLKYNNV